jgi:hypothetical protein
MKVRMTLRIEYDPGLIRDIPGIRGQAARYPFCARIGRPQWRKGIMTPPGYLFGDTLEQLLDEIKKAFLERASNQGGKREDAARTALRQHAMPPLPANTELLDVLRRIRILLNGLGHCSVNEAHTAEKIDKIIRETLKGYEKQAQDGS